ncbi:MAG: branched-chain amino acid ABC transporter permease [Clostridiales bacterium]|nr:branched-chain amino acid ABC transporter permease [Clostridiales bacterium]
MSKKPLHIKTPVRYLINALLFAALLFGGRVLIAGGGVSPFYVGIVTLAGINIILAVSLNMATGYLGQLPLGHAGFMAVGAYASAIFMTRSGLDPAVAMPFGLLIGGLVAAIFGVLIGIPALRLKGDYIAIITLGFGEIIRIVLLNIDEVLGFPFTYGAASLKGIPETSTFFNTFLLVGVTCFAIHTLMKSRHGRAILSIRENEIAADSCGVNLTYYKVMGFTVSAFFAGIAGSLYAGYLGILNPSNFSFMKSIEILVFVVLGGMGSMIGSVLSATVLTILPELLRQFAEWRMIVYALLLILVMVFKPSGLMGRFDFSMGRMLENIINVLTGRKTLKGKGGKTNG